MNKRKPICLMAAALLCFSAASCGDKDKKTDSSQVTAVTTSADTTAVTTEPAATASEASTEAETTTTAEETTAEAYVAESKEYSDKDHVAAYIHEFGHLPSNYISKSKARKAGWKPSKGNLDEGPCLWRHIGGQDPCHRA